MIYAYLDPFLSPHLTLPFPCYGHNRPDSTLELYIVHPEIQCTSPTLMHASITWGSCGPLILIQ